VDRSQTPNDVIRASEVGEYVRCNRAWWLGRVQGVENANRAVMDAGTERHHVHGQQVRGARLLGYAAVGLVLVALVAGLALLLRIMGTI
jgi:hypothetical protein